MLFEVNFLLSIVTFLSSAVLKENKYFFIKKKIMHVLVVAVVTFDFLVISFILFIYLLLFIYLFNFFALILYFCMN